MCSLTRQEVILGRGSFAFEQGVLIKNKGRFKMQMNHATRSRAPNKMAMQNSLSITGAYAEVWIFQPDEEETGVK